MSEIILQLIVKYIEAKQEQVHAEFDAENIREDWKLYLLGKLEAYSGMIEFIKQIGREYKVWSDESK